MARLSRKARSSSRSSSPTPERLTREETIHSCSASSSAGRNRDAGFIESLAKIACAGKPGLKGPGFSVDGAGQAELLLIVLDLKDVVAAANVR